MSSTDSTSADRSFLHFLTQLELEKLEDRKIIFEEVYSQIMKQVNDDTMSLAYKIQIFNEGIEKLFDCQYKQKYLPDFNHLLTIANANTSTSTNLLETFCQRQRKIIESGKRRLEYNYLFKLIVSQWLSLRVDVFTPAREELMTTTTNNCLISTQRSEKIIFDQPLFDLDTWRNFLQNKLFCPFTDNQKLKNVFEELKNATSSYGRSLLEEKVSSDDVQRAIQSLVNNSLEKESRKRSMKQMQSDENTVAELSSELTLMISNLAEWNWPSEGVRGFFRQNLTGQYRCFYEEDFSTAIFLEHVGLKWSYYFKEALQKLFDLSAENSETSFFSQSIQYERIEMQRKNFWMSSLPDKTNETIPSADLCSDGVSFQDKLLHLINVEIQLHQSLHPDLPFSVVCANLEWCESLISHEMVQIFLDMCGMPQIWHDFVDRFLKQPVFYYPAESVRQRQQGVPVSHSLSSLFSELLLFSMDLYVYRSTGIFNYRLHGDFWFLNSSLSKVEQAWKLMNEYAQMIGLKFNSEKCGSVQIRSLNSKEHNINLRLPEKDVKCGLLTLQSAGRFVVDQNTIKPFVDEMKLRIISCSTIFEWVKLYNEYMAFFMRNFGISANTLGTFHTQQIIAAFQFIHQHVFNETSGNALTMLTNRIHEQFPACLTGEILEGWMHWPLVQGGLGLMNIYLDLYSVHQLSLEDTQTIFAELSTTDVQVYAELKENYEKSKEDSSLKFQLDSQYRFLEKYFEDNGSFMTYNEFISRRETCLPHWGDAYKMLLELTKPLLPTQTLNPENQWKIVERQKMISSNEDCSQQNQTNDNYSQWLMCYYGEQIESTFHQLDIVNSRDIPASLIRMMKTTIIDYDKESR